MICSLFQANGWISANVKKEETVAEPYYPQVEDLEWRYTISYKDEYNLTRYSNCGNLYLGCEIAKSIDKKFAEVTLCDNLANVRFCVAGIGFKRLGATRSQREKARVVGNGS